MLNAESEYMRVILITDGATQYIRRERAVRVITSNVNITHITHLEQSLACVHSCHERISSVEDISLFQRVSGHRRSAIFQWWFPRHSYVVFPNLSDRDTGWFQRFAWNKYTVAFASTLWIDKQLKQHNSSDKSAVFQDHVKHHTRILTQLMPETTSRKSLI